MQDQAETRFNMLVEQMADREGVNEQLKASDQMRWVAKIQTLGFFEKSKLLSGVMRKSRPACYKSLDFFFMLTAQPTKIF